MYRPDVAGWRRERLPQLPRESPLATRPDWICEILSPSNKQDDLFRKLRTYQRCQVPHYWILDPDEGTLTVYRWADEGYLELMTAERGEEVRPEPFEAIPLRVGALFGDDEADG